MVCYSGESMELLRRHRDFWIFLLLSVIARFWNLTNSLYFIWDQGRDAWAIQRILSGDITLIGPTSGLQGFFLGPLWFYAGVPGYFLSGGNPYGIATGYMLQGCLALPLYWLIAHRLFPDNRRAQVLAYFLSFLSGSLGASVFIWNPLISMPLVAGALYCLLRARTSRTFLALAFFLFALTLQSEFAYAVFFLGPLTLAIPWIRQRWDWRDFAMAGGAGAITLLPQLLFEWRNDWVMTKSLLASLQDSSKNMPWIELWKQRPEQLYQTTTKIMVGTLGTAWLVFAGILICIAVALWGIWRLKRIPAKKVYEWRLVSLLAALPYVFYMLWRGNQGYFFSYYLTPHFIFLTPLFILGLSEIFEHKIAHFRLEAIRLAFLAVVAGGTLLGGLHTLDSSIVFPENNGGLAAMLRAVDQIYDWQDEDGQEQAVVSIYTRNIQTEHYDYLFSWRAKQKGQQVPLTVRTDQSIWYLLIEGELDQNNSMFRSWYHSATTNGTRLRSIDMGVGTIETWQTTSVATQSAMLQP
jgi:hypothetical protein